MPSPDAILASLKVAANDSVAVAIVWHLAAVAAILALIARWRPSRRLAGFLLTTPIASASIVALRHGNPFNASLLGALAIQLAAIAWHFDGEAVQRDRGPLAVVGAAMLGFGLFYPHFLDRAPGMYLIAAPAGLIPCPTLSLVIGFTLFGGGFGSKAWTLTLALVGLFYGLFGMFRLGVMLDVGLVAGAGVLLLAAVRSPRRRAQLI